MCGTERNRVAAKCTSVTFFTRLGFVKYGLAVGRGASKASMMYDPIVKAVLLQSVAAS